MSSLEEAVKAEISQALHGLPKESRRRVVRRVIEKYRDSEELNRAADEFLAAAPEPTSENLAKALELRDGLGRVVVDLDAERDRLKTQKAKLEKLCAWVDDGAVPVLGRKEHSSLHKLREAEQAGAIKGYDLTPILIESKDVIAEFKHTFLVRNNWAAAFEGAEGLEGEIKLPYDFCAFEFMISGWPMIALAFDREQLADVPQETPGLDAMSGGVNFTLFVGCGEDWFSMDNSASDNKLVRCVWEQIRAICIALDAEVATHEVVRAPAKLNEKRIKAGKQPLCDHHIVNLARRHRIANPVSSGEGTKKRLHFRRGHWRHYETFNTWVRWCLVGDPNLGFIDKHYAI